jgi:hypothetical protein
MNTANLSIAVSDGYNSTGKSRERGSQRGEDDTRTPRAFDFEGDNENFFSLPPVKAGNSALMALKGNASHLPLISDSSEIANSMLMKPDSASASLVDDGDAWVDTDSIDESELEPHSSISKSTIPIVT